LAKQIKYFVCVWGSEVEARRDMGRKRKRTSGQGVGSSQKKEPRRKGKPGSEKVVREELGGAGRRLGIIVNKQKTGGEYSGTKRARSCNGSKFNK